MKKSRVLLVDDDESNLEVLQELITHHFEGELVYVSVRSGIEAVKRFKAEEFDLIITDWEMSEGNGQFVLTEKSKHQIKTPILVWTGKLDLEKQVILEMGASSVIFKCIPFNELVNAIGVHVKV